MSLSLGPTPDTKNHPESKSFLVLFFKKEPLPISTVFLFHGLIIGAWATQVPLLKERLSLSPGALGLALFCLSIGAIASMPATGWLATRFGAAPVIRAGAMLACTAFVAVVLSPDRVVLSACLFVFGMGFGAVDVAMNAEAVRVEQRAERNILGSVHAMWSVGSCAGSAGGSVLLGMVPPPVQAASMALLSSCAIVAVSRWLGHASKPGSRAGAVVHRPWRDGTLLFAGLVLCLAFAVEGAVADWGGVYLRVVRQVPVPLAAMGYSAFSLCMVGMRLAGDRVRARLGNAGVLAGAFAAAAGIGLVLAAPSLPLAVLGFGLTGLGVANVVPALFALAGTRGGPDPNAAVSVTATLGYAGVLAGPPLFGAVAQATSLPVAVGMIAVLCCAVGASGIVLRRGASAPGGTFRHGG